MEIYQKSIVFSNKLLCRKISSGKVLDIGGAEYTGRANAVSINAESVTILDITHPRQNLAPKVTFKQKSVENLSPEDGLFDHIILSNVLEHLNDPLNALKKASTVLKKSGYIHILSPNCESLNRRIGVIMKELSSIREIPEKEKAIGHIQTFTVNDLRKLFKDAGLSELECRGIFLKPVPTPEMIKWPEERINAFFEIASQVPAELCHEVYFQLQKFYIEEENA
jgi:2-polyprenyl-3-methyl-5-hydroxy-6-metoxy-1,4-benzoquinol methylase